MPVTPPTFTQLLLKPTDRELVWACKCRPDPAGQDRLNTPLEYEAVMGTLVGVTVTLVTVTDPSVARLLATVNPFD